MSGLLLVGSWLEPLCAGGQATPAAAALPSIIPPSPTAAALEKYVNLPPGTYTGIPSISLPLYEIKVRDLTVPISLSYHAGGNRVDEEASWVGLGWTLNAGGAISCTIRGKQDDIYAPMAPYPMPVLGYNEYTEACTATIGDTTYDYHGAFARSEWDLDLYSFNFLSYTGQYVLQQQFSKGPHKLPTLTLVPRLLTQQKMRIEVPDARVPGSSRRLIAADGTVYDFSVQESTTIVGSNLSHPTAFYLARITSPQGEVVTFDYDDATTTPSLPAIYPVSSYADIQTIRSQHCRNTRLIEGGGFTSLRIEPAYLAKITFRTGYVLFKRDPVERADLRGGQRLQTIQVFETGNPVPLREFAFGASYTQSPTESLPDVFSGYGTNYSRDARELAYAGKRLQLDQVQERSSGLTKPPYRFTYNTLKLPVKTSYQRDHWGYFNGQTANHSLLPSYKGPAYGISTDYLVVGGANREPNPATLTAGLLQTIQYPTGGTTQFTFEGNEYGNLREDEFYTDSTLTVEASQQATGVQKVPNTPAVVVPFHVSAEHAQVNLNLEMHGRYVSGGFVPSRTYISVRKPDRSWQQVYDYGHYGSESAAGGIATISFTLEPGAYELEVCVEPGNGPASQPPQQLEVRANLSWQERAKTTYKKYGPGVRVAQIVSDDGQPGAHKLVRKYFYNSVVEERGPHASSTGVLMNRPLYWRYKEQNYVIPPSCEDHSLCPETYDLCRGFQLCSYSNTLLQHSALGSPIGYSQVEEWQGPQAEGGKIVYHFINSEDLTVTTNASPGLPQASNPLNGYLTKQTLYTSTDHGFAKASETTTSYDLVQEAFISGAQKPLEVADYYHRDGTFGDVWCVMPMHTYFLRSQWIQLTGQTQRRYDPQEERLFQETSTAYTYDEQQTGHMQVSRTTSTRSDGATEVTHTTYPADYSLVTSGPLAAMRSDAVYQHSLPVESVTQVYGAGQSPLEAKTIGGTYLEYAPVGSAGKYQPVRVSTLELTQPTAGLAPAAPALPARTQYVPKERRSYDLSTGNVREVRPVGGLPTAYLWGYQQTLPVAQLQNVTATQAAATLTALGINLNTLATDAQFQQACAQLRQQLPQARITSFTHRPLVGLTSQTDPSGRTVSYEYDGLGRLVRTRDEQGRILSQQQYHYTGK